MAQTQRRMVYLKIWTSEQFGYLSDKAKLLYIGMVTLADDDGRLRANPAYLRGQIFPYDTKITVEDILVMRNEIKNNGLIILYSVDIYEYIQHPKWEDYQSIRGDLYKQSSLPAINEKQKITDEKQPSNETVTKPLRKSTLSKDKLSKDKIIYTSNFENFWKIYPKKVGKKKAGLQWNKLKAEDKVKIMKDIPKRILLDDKWVHGFIKDAERYIRDNQWEDEIIKAKIKGNNLETPKGKYSKFDK